MAESASDHEQKILDARMEYGLLTTSYTSLAQMMWVGYGAFFTLNTLLATGLGFSYSGSSATISKGLLRTVHIGLPVIGIVICVIAIYAAFEIRQAMYLANERGRVLEELLYARLFAQSEAYSRKKPTATVIGSLLFMSIWVAALVSAIV